MSDPSTTEAITLAAIGDLHVSETCHNRYRALFEEISAVADVLAVAVGHFGSMAEYLHNTVRHLQELGIDDRYLWRLQELVAERIEAATDGRSPKTASAERLPPASYVG